MCDNLRDKYGDCAGLLNSLPEDMEKLCVLMVKLFEMWYKKDLASKNIAALATIQYQLTKILSPGKKPLVQSSCSLIYYTYILIYLQL